MILIMVMQATLIGFIEKRSTKLVIPKNSAFLFPTF